MNEYIFVYGTLCRGLFRNEVLKESEYLGIAYCKGTLKDIGDFPGLIDGEDMVIGEAYRLESSSVLDRLDQIEGYFENNEADSLYLRKVKPVRLFSTGEWIEASVYCFNHEADRFPTILSGDYRRYLLEREGGSIFYLAYGSNLKRSKLRERIGTWKQEIKGSLPDFRLVYNKRSAYSTGNVAFANIRTELTDLRTGQMNLQRKRANLGIGLADIKAATAGKDCPCVAYVVDREAIDKLDYYEGVLINQYIRTVLPMMSESGQEILGYTYLAHPDCLLERATVPEDYRSEILQGYQDHELGNLADFEC